MTAPAPHRRRHRWDFLPHATTVQRINRAVAVKVTAGVGSMWCAYAFCLIALAGLPQVLEHFSVLALVQWTAQTLLQLVLLSIILVGQNVAGEASDARAVETLEDTRVIIDRLDTSTQGGLAEVKAEVLAAVGEARKDFALTIQAVTGKMGGEP